MTSPSWVALHGMTCSFIELDKAVVHMICLISSSHMDVRVGCVESWMCGELGVWRVGVYGCESHV